jgi:hypothetical protein
MSASHNHPVRPWGQIEPEEGACPRCDQLRADRRAWGQTQHTHTLLPYGRLTPKGSCPRCDELLGGAQARPGPAKKKGWLA